MFNFKLWLIALLSGALAFLAGAQTLEERVDWEAGGARLEELGRVGSGSAGAFLDILGRGELASPGRLEEVVQIEESVEDELSVPGPIEEDAATEGEEAVPPLPEGEGGINTAMVLPDVQAGEGPGVLEGVVFDADGKGIPGVILVFPGLGGFKVRGGPDGGFRVTGLPAAGVVVLLMKSAYVSKDEVVEVNGEGVTKVRIGMELRPIELAEGEYTLESREVLLDYEEDEFGGIVLGEGGGAGLAGGLGREQFAEVGVSDAAGALTKVSGANIVGGRYAVVRGLGDRYTNTTINRGLVPSADPSRKAVQLDLFPTDLLQSVVVQKTFRPDLPAEFVGGLIAIETMRLPDEPQVGVSIGRGWNSEAQGVGAFRVIPGSEMNFLAENDDDILKNGLVNPVLPTGGRRVGSRVIPPGSDELAKEAWGYVYRSTPFFSETTGTPEWDRDLSAMVSDRVELHNGMTFGWFANFTHSRDTGYKNKIVTRARGVQLSRAEAAAAVPGRFLSTYESPTQNAVSGIGTTSYRSEEEFTKATEWGLLIGGTLEMGEAHSVTGTYFRYRTGEDTVKFSPDLIQDNGSGSTAAVNEVVRGTSVVNVGNGIGNVEVRQYWDTLESTYRDLEVMQLGGSHDFRDGGRGLAFDWLVGRTEASEERPRSVNTRLFQLTTPTGETYLTPYNYYAPSNPQDSFILSTSTMDTASEMRLDGTLSLQEDSSEESRLDLKMGAGYYDRRRVSDARRLRLGPGSALRNTLSNPVNGQNQVNDLESGEPIIDGVQPSQSGGWIVADITGNLTLAYEGQIELFSTYLMGDWAWEGWNVVAGVRMEDEHRVFSRRTSSLEQDSSNFFPSIFVSKRLGDRDQFAIEAAWSKTIARPIFYEFVDAFTLDQANDEEFRGNPALRDTMAVNADLRLSWTGEDPGNSLAVGFFMKDLDGPIFQTQDPFASGRVTWLNLPSATVKGIELDFAKSLGGGFKAYGNISRIGTEVEAGVFNNPGGSGTAVVEAESLEGQPNWLGNLSLVHEYEPWGLSTTLSYNYTGSYLHRTVPGVGATEENPQPPNIIRQPFQSLDLILSKKWEGENHSGKVSFKVRNLLDADEEFTYGDLDIEPFSKYSPGQSYSVSVDIEW